MKLLLSYNANADLCEYKSKETPLHVAAAWGYAEICELLLTAGANTECRDEKGKTPLHKAVTSKAESV